MGLLDGLIGGVVGAGAMKLIEDVIEKNGGVQGLVANFEQNGLGALAGSWVGTGANQPVSAEQLHQTLGAEKVSALAQQTGMDPQALLAQLAEHLPDAVDKLTPNGTIS